MAARLGRLPTGLAVFLGGAFAAACAAAQPDPSAPAPMCGGVAGRQCPAGLVCIMEGAPHPDQSGTCRPATSRTVCPQIYQPVCGVDGRTYPNRCIAGGRGAAVAHAGRCEEPPSDGPAPPRPDGERR